MSTLGSVTNNALKSLIMNQLALSVASNNIANAQSPEYTRQRLIIAPSGPDGGNLSIGTGVDVLGIKAIRDQLIENRLRQETAARSGHETLTNALGDVEVLFNDSDDTGLLRSLTRFFNSFHTLSLDPASMNFREELRVNANALANKFHTLNADLKNIQQLGDKAITDSVDKVNTLLSQIAAVSREIKFQEGSHPSHDLYDRRSALVRELTEIVEVNELNPEGGDYQLSTAGSNRLLLITTTAYPLTASEVTAAIGEGSLKAKVDIRDTYVPKYLAALDQLAFEISQEVNSIHSTAFDLDGNTGNNFFTPLASASDASRLISLSASVSGDARTIAASEFAVGNDNHAAMQLGNLLHDQVFSGGSVVDQYQTLVFTLGTDLASSGMNLTQHKALEHQLENRRAAVSGVSIEEETIQVLQFQRAYQASARLITTVDELLQTLIGMVPR